MPPPDGFGIRVSVWQLRRYYYRLTLDHSPQAPSGLEPQTAQTISDIIDRAALGENYFTPAAIHLLEKRAFELAFAGTDPAPISILLGIVLKSRDTTTRERVAEVQKQKLALKQRISPESQQPI